MATREIGQLPEAHLTFERDEDGDWVLEGVRIMEDCEDSVEAKDCWEREISELGPEFFMTDAEEGADLSLLMVRGRLVYIEHDSIDCGKDYDAEFVVTA
jgi:hypothetical protein